MPTVTTPDADIFYTDSGGEGPVLLLGHGFFMDSSMFAPQVRDLSPDLRVVTWDARRHGKTTDAGMPFTYWDLARDALAVLDDLGVEKAIIGGMSQGGYTALRTALLAPERTTALILLDTEASACTPEQKSGYRVLFDQWCSTEPLEPLTSALAPQLIGGEPADWTSWISKWNSSDRMAVRPAAECLIERDDVVDRLSDIDVPALIIRGENDLSAPAEKADELKAGLPGAAPVVTIPVAGHAANWTHPEPVNAAIAAFVKALR
ncbi:MULTISPECIES: alpha/beta fold hydrolase [unclassified Rhodococcus (in: high G+C Gram-positive bacteria)]|uniref:alpha/beta fold hydrolase n=1 Tax=unclassified Rhodococcus (in: high G+C Gram-positive bacteria) TaxID=192944 RepID=UPI002954BDD2|nr:alpha/beta hydrolase [Rhodococcus sp. IEGM 27]MDV8030788.1 alpha/beta hydrolase [Rhodococcus sp. IEGM 27]